MTLKNAVCIVTGSAAGIGAACAERLASKGARLAINYTRSEKEAHEVAAACEAKCGQTVVVRAYAASKGALNTMTLSLARALGHAIRVNAVCPGFVETRWLTGGLGPEYESKKKNYESITPLRATVKPEDVADAVVWLLEGAAKVTGELITVDSGVHLGSAR